MDKTISRHSAVDKHKEKEMWEEVKKFSVKNSDVFLLGYLKSGTTWAQEMIWLIVNDLDFEGAKTFVDERVPVLDMSGYLYKDMIEPINVECHWNSVEFTKKLKDPRCIKTHLKWELLPEEILNETKKPKAQKCQIIYIARNPKDVCLSSYCFLKNVTNSIDCTFEEYCDSFLRGHNDRHENYWNNILYFWERRNRPNVLFIKYEDMKHNLANVIRKVATFLEKTITDKEELQLVKWLNFETMKNNEAVNHINIYQKSGFIRVGKVGEHINAMSSEIIKKFDTWIADNLKDSDYKI